jgi:hypothetical protein
VKTLINIWDKDKNFWALNPVFKSLEHFRDLYEADTEKKKAKSKTSKDLWFVAFYCDFASPLSDLADDPDSPYGKQKLVSSNVMGDQDYWHNNNVRLATEFEMYEMFAFSTAQRSLKAWYTKLQQRDKVLKDTDYLVGMTDANGKLANSNVAILDKMLVDSGKIWEQYFKISEQIESEGSTGTAKGGSEESASDTGAI